MSRLDDIEREAKERRDAWTEDDELKERVGPPFTSSSSGIFRRKWDEAEAAVDELVAMVKDLLSDLRRVDHAKQMAVQAWQQADKERDQARAAALMLRDAIKSDGVNEWYVDCDKTYADTEWLEEHR